MFQLGKRPWAPLASALVAVVTVAVVLATPGSAGAANRPAQRSGPVAAAVAQTGTLSSDQVAMTSRVTGTASDGSKVTGKFVPGSFRVNDAGDMVARGTLHLVIQEATGTVRATQRGVDIPVSTLNGTPAKATAASSTSRTAAAAPAATGTCPVLNLVLGPLDLNLLGLVVHLNKVVLNIVAQSGAGELLGNLLCAVAGLLDGTPLSGLLGQVATLLNSILAILRM